MDHAVGSFDIGEDDFGVIDHHLIHVDHDVDELTLQRLSLAQLDHISCHHLTIHNVVQQDVGQRGDIREQGFDRPLR